MDNRDNQVSSNAENIRTLLFSKGEMDVRQIGEHTFYRDSVIYIAIGWLIKEDKIRMEDKNGKLYFALKMNITEIYY